MRQRSDKQRKVTGAFEGVLAGLWGIVMTILVFELLWNVGAYVAGLLL